MIAVPSLIAQAVSDFEPTGEPIQVSLSNELVGLLSDQLYQSPVKAIEELVVNSYDADAKECRIFVPSPDDLTMDYIVIYDDGIGMDQEGLTNLWRIGRSNKRDEEIERRRSRKQIGRFGIGKLATYAVANLLTIFAS
jgi:HSP90 family molecular chaperone